MSEAQNELHPALARKTKPFSRVNTVFVFSWDLLTVAKIQNLACFIL